jgi:Ala-tRNA(Pro) deacylase
MEGFMSLTSSIHKYLGEARVAYTVLPHTPAYTAQEGAAATRVPGRDWAKVVICVADGKPIQAVLSATSEVDLDLLGALAGAKAIRLAVEGEVRDLFPDCELGAMPPFGPLYGQRVFVDGDLAVEPVIVFNAGTHTQAIRMRYADFAATTRPTVGWFAVQSRDRAVEWGRVDGGSFTNWRVLFRLISRE